MKEKIIVVCSGVKSCQFLSLLFNFLEVPCAYVHGEQSQNQRNSHIKQFSSNDKSLLLISSLSLRTIDIPEHEWFLQYDIPQSLSFYNEIIKKIASAKALLFVDPSEKLLIDKLKDSGIESKEIPFDEKKIPKLHLNIEKWLAKNYGFYTSSQFAYREIIASYVHNEISDVFKAASLPLLDVAINYGIKAPPKLPLN